MDAGSLPDTINPNNFPAKLWRLINNPTNRAISWDSLGEVVVIDRALFESQILSKFPEDNANAFKTTNFSSFIRQLNLYGFKRCDPVVTEHSSQWDGVARQYFSNPNFKRDHPELVADLKRLTVDNKAKLQAGLDIHCRPPSRYKRFSGDGGGEVEMKRAGSLPFSPGYWDSSQLHLPNKGQAITGHKGTPIPPRYLMRGHGSALPPPVYASDKGIPLSLGQQCPVASCSNAVQLQHVLMAHGNKGNHNLAHFIAPNAQYQPSWYSPVCQCYSPNLLAAYMTTNGLQARPFSPHSYYQGSYAMNMCCGDQNPQGKGNQEVNKCDVNLDRVFQIADEVMQPPPSGCVVRVVTPEKPGPVLVTSSSPSNTAMYENSTASTKVSPLCDGPRIVSVTGSSESPSSKAQDSVVSVSEQVPEDAAAESSLDMEDDDCSQASMSSSRDGELVLEIST